ncbi:MAG: transcriptional regulator [Propionibacteriaceae bacterium]|jgi:hypothetical protein|nr:transcriptional regulator [Propionibacteriaceae bacterium]
MAMVDMSVPQVHFRDIKPYFAPDSLDALSGPDGGVIKLPKRVFWVPGDGRVDLDRPGGTALAYETLLQEADAELQEQLINRRRLIEIWPELVLPLRVRRLWEDRFPQLMALAAA